jgi:hypothetical protein
MAIARLKSPNHGIPTCCEDFVTLVNRDVHGLAWDAGIASAWKAEPGCSGRRGFKLSNIFWL